MILYAHPTGNANVRQSLQALCDDDLLAEFWTCIDWDPESPLARLLPGGLRQQLARRTFPDCARGRTRTMPWREAGRLLAPKLGLRALGRHETGPLSVDAVFGALDRRVAKRLPHVSQLRGVYAGEDGACGTFRRARQMGLKRFYDLPIGYWRAAQALYAEEQEREPEWAATLTGTQDSPAKLRRKDEELALADVVFVASAFTRRTLETAPAFAGRVQVVPYGAPPATAAPTTDAPPPKLRLLYVGSLTQRKGLSYLLRAVESVQKHVELTIIGTRPVADCAPLNAALGRHRWVESLPHAGILAEMRRHDLLLFPSLFEGFGLVILEAMSQGLPVVATPHTAGPDVITDGQDGFLVPIRSPEAIAEKIGLLLDCPARLADMRRAAWETAQRRTWEDYRNALTQIVRAELDR